MSQKKKIIVEILIYSISTVIIVSGLSNFAVVLGSILLISPVLKDTLNSFSLIYKFISNPYSLKEKNPAYPYLWGGIILILGFLHPFTENVERASLSLLINLFLVALFIYMANRLKSLHNNA